jgi:hypothetical protein
VEKKADRKEKKKEIYGRTNETSDSVGEHMKFKTWFQGKKDFTLYKGKHKFNCNMGKYLVAGKYLGMSLSELPRGVLKPIQSYYKIYRHNKYHNLFAMVREAKLDNGFKFNLVFYYMDEVPLTREQLGNVHIWRGGIDGHKSLETDITMNGSLAWDIIQEILKLLE